LAYHRSDRRLTIGPKQEDENGNGNKERRDTGAPSRVPLSGQRASRGDSRGKSIKGAAGVQGGDRLAGRKGRGTGDSWLELDKQMERIP